MTQDEKPEHKVGERCCLGEHTGTVRYVGQVPPTKGSWYGVEWDDERGKHNGTLNGVNYFECRDKYGSFVRPHKISFGVDSTSIMKNTYGGGVYEGETIVINEQSKASEKVIEMVGFEKVALQQSDLEVLKEADLSSTEISHANKDEPIENLCPNLNYLNLSKTLISTFKDVFEIAGNLKNLKVLNISDNKINDWSLDQEVTSQKFPKLRAFYLNNVDIRWEELVSILEFLPTVTEVYSCFNKKIKETSESKRMSQLEILNLEGCSITSWEALKGLAGSSNLNWLILNDNQIKYIPSEEINGIFPGLNSLSLTNNNIESWQSINNLRNLSRLNELRFRNNPACKDMTSFQLRQELIARLESVGVINGSRVEEAERRVAEVSYIKNYSKEYFSSKSDESKIKCFELEHPRFSKLIEVHGPPTEEKSTSQRLKENLLEISISCPDCQQKKSIVKKLPATMTIQQLKGIIQRSLKVQNVKQKLSYLDEKNSREIELDDNMKQLSYYSLASGDKVYVRW